VSETTCPLCGTPRPKGAEYCVCGLQFQKPKKSLPFVLLAMTAFVSTGLWYAMRRCGYADPGHRSLSIALFVIAGVLLVCALFGWVWLPRTRRTAILLDRGDNEAVRAAFAATAAFLIAYGLLDY
jgi:hypothetical protein